MSAIQLVREAVSFLCRHKSIYSLKENVSTSVLVLIKVSRRNKVMIDDMTLWVLSWMIFLKSHFSPILPLSTIATRKIHLRLEMMVMMTMIFKGVWWLTISSSLFQESKETWWHPIIITSEVYSWEGECVTSREHFRFVLSSVLFIFPLWIIISPKRFPKRQRLAFWNKNIF